ncbi:MAG: peptide deformylase [Nitrospirae bacterium]|nr:peptide deformylase [Nitrospirota bacterium]
MAVLEIKTFPDKILKEKTSPVTEFGSGLQSLIDDMIETMYASSGVGLAANQVGAAKRVIVIDVSSRDENVPLLILLNPEIVLSGGEVEDEEGCLSIPGYRTIIKRAENVTVSGLDRHGKPVEIEGSGLLSRALQHEIDHLNGLLIIDRIGTIKREFFKKRYRKTVTSNE